MTRISPSRFTTRTLGTTPWGASVCRILSAAVQAVDPVEMVARSLRQSGDHLQIGGVEYDLALIERVFLLALGKAGASMASAAVDALGNRLDGGLVIVKPGHAQGIPLPPVLRLIEAGHPIPNEGSLQAAELAANLLANSSPSDLVLCLISGGGSSLLFAPLPGISLEDIQKLTAALLACGADISEINTLRKHLDQVKGGGLARLAAPAQVISLILSDVIGDSLDLIASGPTAPDPSTYSDCVQILERYKLSIRIPQTVNQFLRCSLAGAYPETPKPGDPIFERVQNVIIGSNQMAAQAAVQQAQVEGFNTILLTTSLQGEARQAGRFLASIANQIVRNGQPLHRPACVIAGGETTVTVRGEGLGGRNQELALGAVTDLSDLPDVALVTLATDGGDGPTDAAGAVVTGETLMRARQAGLEPWNYLQRNDSYHFFEALDDLIKPGPTMTNVNDLSFIFAF